MVQNKMHHRLIHVDSENEGVGEDTHSFEHSFAFHKVELKPCLSTLWYIKIKVPSSVAQHSKVMLGSCVLF